jgi:DNA-nicking Smr family endonuclease
MSEPIPLPIDGVLDLHTFRPQDVREVVLAYLEACQEKGILEVRVVHGKGIGQLRQTVHALLARHPEVLSYSLAGEAYGGAGATFVHLRPLPAGAG